MKRRVSPSLQHTYHVSPSLQHTFRELQLFTPKKFSSGYFLYNVLCHKNHNINNHNSRISTNDIIDQIQILFSATDMTDLQFAEFLLIKKTQPASQQPIGYLHQDTTSLSMSYNLCSYPVISVVFSIQYCVHV